MGFPNDDKGMLWVNRVRKDWGALKWTARPGSGHTDRSRNPGGPALCIVCRVLRLLRADPAAETAAGALMRQKRHIIAPGTFGTGGAKKGSRRADAGADPAGCAAFFKMREHPGKAGSGRGFAGFSCVFGELFYFVEQNLPPQCSVGNRFLRKRQEGGSSPSGLCHEQG